MKTITQSSKWSLPWQLQANFCFLFPIPIPISHSHFRSRPISVPFPVPFPIPCFSSCPPQARKARQMCLSRFETVKRRGKKRIPVHSLFLALSAELNPNPNHLATSNFGQPCTLFPSDVYCTNILHMLNHSMHAQYKGKYDIM